MARAKESNFAPSTIRLLRDRVASLCSNPDCRKSTIAASLETNDKTTIIGEAAHIKAASSGAGGARFDDNMSYDERRSIDNGIWLCKNCHRMIDREPIKYSVENLKRWKSETEEYASKSLGIKYKTDENIKEAQQSLLSIMPLSSINNALSNVHGSVVQTLGVLDNRLKLSTKFDNEATVYSVEPKDDSYVPTISIKDFSKESNIRKYKDLILHGLDCDIDGDIDFSSDSNLINKLLNDTSIDFKKASIKRINKVNAYIKIPYQDSDTNKTVVKIDGYLTHGLKTVSFIGGLECYFKFEVIGMPMFDESITDTVQNFNMSFCFNDWNGKNIRSLDKLEDLYILINEICYNENASIGLFTSETHTFLAKAKINNASDNDDIKQIKWLLNYIYKSYKICDYLNYEAFICLDSVILEKDYKQILEVYDTLFENKVHLKKDIKSNPTLQLSGVSGDEVKILVDNPSLELEYTSHDEEYLRVFKNTFKLPNRKMRFSNFSAEANRIAHNDSFMIELIPNDNSETRIEFLIE
ncbi:MAG: HNH endonuclease signature motif containing protein [Psychrobacter sp.]